MSIASLYTSPVRALVVGGTAGIGAAIAINLAKNLPSSSRITIAGRNKSAADQIISAHSGNSHIDFRPINAFLMKDVKQFCADYTSSLQTPCDDSKQSLNALDLLILTPGILSLSGRTITPPEKIDRKMALHYYSRALVIRELQSILSPSALIMSVLDGKTSDIHSKSIKWDDLDLAKPGSFGVPAAAAHCQAMNDGLMEAFSAQDDRVYVHAFPGLVNTDLGKGLPFAARLFIPVAKLFAYQPDDCAENMLTGAVAAAKEGKGRYNVDDKGRLVTKKEAGQELRGKVWDHTWHLVDSQQ